MFGKKKIICFWCFNYDAQQMLGAKIQVVCNRETNCDRQERTPICKYLANWKYKTVMHIFNKTEKRHQTR